MKLILFDIDGTLIQPLNVTKYIDHSKGETKFSYAIRKVFHKDTVVNLVSIQGVVDRKILWDAVSSLGISRAAFEKEFPNLAAAMHEYMVKGSYHGSLYKPIPSAREFVDLLVHQDTIAYGLLTGNVKSIAHWKLEKAGYDDIFQFGLYGEETDDRIELAKTVFDKAAAFFHTTFHPHDVVVIGDTKHDIRCGKAIDAVTVGVTTGMKEAVSELAAEQPDFLISSLMDNSLLDYLQLKKV